VKILAVNWQDPENPHAGGAEIHLFEILARLVERGNSVTVLCSGFEAGAPLAVHRGIQIHRVGGRFSFPLHAARYYRRRLAGEHFDVILDDINKVPLCTPLWGTRTPVVALVPHLFGTTAFQELPAPLASIVWISERPIPLIYRNSLFHAISQSTAEDLVGRGVRRDRITVIYPGIDCARFTPDSSRRSATPLLAYLGRLKRYKGIDLVLRALARVTTPGVRLEIAGTGDYRPELERLTHSLGLRDRVSFLGFVDEAEKLDLLRRAWALVFTSPKEGWGITNLEAQASGTPVIASDSPGLRESVLPSLSGLLVPHGNLAALASAMDSLASSPESVKQMGARGREFAATFSWDRTAEQSELHIKGAIERARRVPPG
jgi:glycosyltransferase involved in cell wall biosynthesis